MRAPLARLLTAMHSPEWKVRYGAEFEALLTDMPASPFTVTDVAGSIVVSRRGTLVAALALSAILVSVLCGIPRQRSAANVALSKHTASPALCLTSTRPRREARIPCALG